MRMNPIFILVPAAALAMLSAASAAPAIVRTTVNFRQAPGTGALIIGKIPGGSSVDVANCGPKWCQVSFQGKSGFIIGTSLGGAPDGLQPQGAPPPPGYAAPVPAPYPYPYPYPYYGPYYYGYGPYWGWRRRWVW